MHFDFLFFIFSVLQLSSQRQPQGGISLVLNLSLVYVFFEYHPFFTDTPPILTTTITLMRLIKRGYQSLLAYYLKVSPTV